MPVVKKRGLENANEGNKVGSNWLNKGELTRYYLIGKKNQYTTVKVSLGKL